MQAARNASGSMPCMAVAGMMLLPCIVSMQHGGGVALPCRGLFLGWWRMYMRHAYLAIVVLARGSMPVAFAIGGPSCRPAVVWKCAPCLPIALPVLRHFACRSVRPRPAARLPRAACLRLGNSAETPVARACCCNLSPLSGIMMVLFCGLCGLYAICSEIRASKLAIIVM